MATKHAIRRLAHQFGFDIHHLQPFADPDQNLILLSRLIDADIILDVGANDGSVAEHLINAGFTGQIISFEPQTDAYIALKKRALRYPNWIVVTKMAVSDKSGNQTLHLAGNSSSSSFLDMLATHEQAAPESVYIGSEEVSVFRLDEVVPAIIPGCHRFVLKIDTQGTEALVLAGATGILHDVVAVKIEMSIVPLYDGQPLFKDIYDRMTELGFDVWDISPVLRDNHTGRMLQCDGTFVRSGSVMEPIQ